MAVQVRPSEQAGSSYPLVRPHLYVIDFTANPPASNPHRSILDRRQALRRRRMARRLRQAGEAAGWAAGSALLLALVLSGLAGLLH